MNIVDNPKAEVPMADLLTLIASIINIEKDDYNSME